MCGILIGNIYAPNGNPWPGPEVRLQARVDGPAGGARAGLARQQDAGGSDRGLQRHPDREDVYKPERWAKDALIRAGGAGEVSRAGRAGLDRRDAQAASRRSAFTLSGIIGGTRSHRDAGIRIDHALLSPALAKKLKAAGVDRTPRGWEKTSDHAPMWIELEI